MIVQAISNEVTYIGTGSVGPFTFSFNFYEDTDLVVTIIDLLGVHTILALNADYTVTGAGSDTGGSITLTVALTNDYTLTIVRTLPIEQDTSLPNQGPYFASAIEAALDYIIMVCQQLYSLYLDAMTAYGDLEMRVLVLEGLGYFPPAVVAGASTKTVMTGTLSLTFVSGMKEILFLDPNGANRQVDFLQTPTPYPAGYEVYVYNYGPFVIILDSVALIPVPAGQGRSIYFDGAAWYA